MAESRINIRISPEKKEVFKKKADSEGKKITDVILELIDQYLGESKESHPVELVKRVEALEKKLGELVA